MLFGYFIFWSHQGLPRGVETGMYPYSILTISVNFTSFLNILERFWPFLAVFKLSLNTFTTGVGYAIFTRSVWPT
jgi:hypothetical protein